MEVPITVTSVSHISAAILFFYTITLYTPTASAIGCFVCSSVNGSNPLCEDTFNSSGKYYQSECKAGRKGRTGRFPGTECIKMKAWKGSGTDAITIIVRQCVVDNGGVNSEVEIGRSNHCGFVDVIKYNNEMVNGCILSCATDGCNHGNRLRYHFITNAFSLIALFSVYHVFIS